FHLTGWRPSRIEAPGNAPTFTSIPPPFRRVGRRRSEHDAMDEHPGEPDDDIGHHNGVEVRALEHVPVAALRQPPCAALCLGRTHESRGSARANASRGPIDVGLDAGQHAMLVPVGADAPYWPLDSVSGSVSPFAPFALIR